MVLLFDIIASFVIRGYIVQFDSFCSPYGSLKALDFCLQFRSFFVSGLFCGDIKIGCVNNSGIHMSNTIRISI